MNILEASRIARKPVAETARPFRLLLACGFTPLYMETLLTAHLRIEFPEYRIIVEKGLYGDIGGTLRTNAKATADSTVVLLEWDALDPRLGLRGAGAWGPKSYADILRTAQARLEQLGDLLEDTSSSPVVLCLPTLPLPPVGYTPSWQAHMLELRLVEFVTALSSRAVQRQNVRVVSRQSLDLISPLAARYDINSDVVSGFPYSISHASAMAKVISRLVRQPPPKKGLISDLDDTLWSGLVGEVGVEGVHWDLDHHSQIHGLYQTLLDALASEGTLVAVASKNDPGLITRVMERGDLRISTERIWPVEVHWGRKSESVSRILKAWNIGASDVIFVDDSPMELAEVQTAHPDLQCLLFPRDDYRAGYELLLQIRDLFGRTAIRDEDTVRIESLRSANALRANTVTAETTPDVFLQAALAELTLSFQTPPPERALELVNKTNQFNLNGRRYTGVEWSRFLRSPGAIVLLASYRDKYGSLGNILVLAGCLQYRKLEVQTWVLSCRAFSRRIEHQCLKELFVRLDLEEVVFDFRETPRNGPMRDFLEALTGRYPSPGLCLSRTSFEDHCPPLYAHVVAVRV